MIVKCIVVSSVNGKTTKGTSPNIYEWTSPEESHHFFSLIEKHNLIVMGRKTYEAAKKVIKLKPDKLRMVLTNTPDSFLLERVERQLEFTNETPRRLVERMASQGYNEMLLVGGAEINRLFFVDGLVDYLLISIEPVLFEQGKEIIQSGFPTIQLQLRNVIRLNERGSILLEYNVMR